MRKGSIMSKALLRCRELVQNIRKALVGSFPSQSLKKGINQKWRKEMPDSGDPAERYELPHAGKNGKPFTTTVNLDFRQIQSRSRKDPSGAHRFEMRPMSCSLILVGEEKKDGQTGLGKQSFTKVDKTAAHP
jgi:hypothetical protein